MGRGVPALFSNQSFDSGQDSFFDCEAVHPCTFHTALEAPGTGWIALKKFHLPPTSPAMRANTPCPPNES